jgi:hypothetical protein
VKLGSNGIAVGVKEHDDGVYFGKGVGKDDTAAAVCQKELPRLVDHFPLWLDGTRGRSYERERQDEGQQGEKPPKPSWSLHGNHLPFG